MPSICLCNNILRLPARLPLAMNDEIGYSPLLKQSDGDLYVGLIWLVYCARTAAREPG